MTARVRILRVNDNSSGVVKIPPVDTILRVRSDLSAWIDAKHAGVDGQSYINSVTSRVPNTDGSEKTATSIDAAHAPYLYTNPDGIKSVRMGYNNDGTTVNNNHVALRGDSTLLLPTGSWYVGFVAAIPVPASLGYLWATSSATTKYAFGFSNTGSLRFYYDYTAGLMQTGASVNDGNPYLWEVMWDGTNLTVYKNRTSVLTGTPTLATVTDRKLRFGAINNAGSDPNSVLPGYWESCFVGSSVSVGLLAAVKAVVLNRHPSWTIA